MYILVMSPRGACVHTNIQLQIANPIVYTSILTPHQHCGIEGVIEQANGDGTYNISDLSKNRSGKLLEKVRVG